MSTGDEVITETISQPCCNSGGCCACDKIGGDAPWLQPKSVGCGRTHKCNFPWMFALHAEELDNGDLPGRPPHTIVCVRAKGKTSSNVVEGLMTGQPGNNDPATWDPCLSYDLYLCVKVPVQIVLRDCAGFLYCLTSMFSQIVKIPLATRVMNLKDTQIYLKARVKLCRTVPVKYPNTSAPPDNSNINHPPTGTQENITTTNPDGEPLPGSGGYGPGDSTDVPADDKELRNNLGCMNLEYAATGDGFGMWNGLPRALPEVRLDILLEACVMRLVPFGIIGDPSASDNKKQPTCLCN
jgi:hypothetical protein